MEFIKLKMNQNSHTRRRLRTVVNLWLSEVDRVQSTKRDILLPQKLYSPVSLLSTHGKGPKQTFIYTALENDMVPTALCHLVGSGIWWGPLCGGPHIIASYFRTWSPGMVQFFKSLDFFTPQTCIFQAWALEAVSQKSILTPNCCSSATCAETLSCNVLPACTRTPGQSNQDVWTGWFWLPSFGHAICKCCTLHWFPKREYTLESMSMRWRKDEREVMDKKLQKYRYRITFTSYYWESLLKTMFDSLQNQTLNYMTIIMHCPITAVPLIFQTLKTIVHLDAVGWGLIIASSPV